MLARDGGVVDAEGRLGGPAQLVSSRLPHGELEALAPESDLENLGGLAYGGGRWGGRRLGAERNGTPRRWCHHRRLLWLGRQRERLPRQRRGTGGLGGRLGSQRPGRLGRRSHDRRLGDSRRGRSLGRRWRRRLGGGGGHRRRGGGGWRRGSSSRRGRPGVSGRCRLGRGRCGRDRLRGCCARLGCSRRPRRMPRCLDHVHFLRALPLRLAGLLALANLMPQVFESLPLPRIPVEPRLPIGGKPRAVQGGHGALHARGAAEALDLAVLHHHPEGLHAAEGQHVAVLQERRHDPRAVHVGAVGRAEVFEHELVDGALDARVDLRHRTTVHHHVRGGRPTQGDLARGDVHGRRPLRFGDEHRLHDPLPGRRRLRRTHQEDQVQLLAQTDHVEMLQPLAHGGLAVQEGPVRALEVFYPVGLAVPLDPRVLARYAFHGHRDRDLGIAADGGVVVLQLEGQGDPGAHVTDDLSVHGDTGGWYLWQEAQSSRVLPGAWHS